MRPPHERTRPPQTTPRKQIHREDRTGRPPPPLLRHNPPPKTTPLLPPQSPSLGNPPKPRRETPQASRRFPPLLHLAPPLPARLPNRHRPKPNPHHPPEMAPMENPRFPIPAVHRPRHPPPSKRTLPLRRTTSRPHKHNIPHHPAPRPGPLRPRLPLQLQPLRRLLQTQRRMGRRRLRLVLTRSIGNAGRHHGVGSERQQGLQQSQFWLRRLQYRHGGGAVGLCRHRLCRGLFL